MATSGFFEKSREQSVVKANIATRYFWAWAKILVRQSVGRYGPERRIAYVDLFAGAGRYKDGTKSIPLRILEEAIKDPDMRRSIITVFNDRNAEHVKSLREAIAATPGVENLTHRPVVFNYEVGESLARVLESTKLVPTFVFIDPWGYKGLSLRLVDSILKDWGSDCLFLFNYNRVNMGIDNFMVAEHIRALFGADRSESLRRDLTPASSQDREAGILRELGDALGAGTGRFVHTFAFKNMKGTRTSHYLVFVSKNQTAYEIMKDITAKESTSQVQGVPSHVFNPAEKAMGTLFDLSHPLDDLMEMLAMEFRGQTITVRSIFRSHNVGRRYILQNYKDALKTLEGEDRVKASPDLRRRKKGTLADWVEITFPA
ncbi:MAG TPA: three-Cys-motif partner protein TcmP [Bacillota bacterium]